MAKSHDAIIDDMIAEMGEGARAFLSVLPKLDFQRVAFAFYIYRCAATGKRPNNRQISLWVGVGRAVGDRQLREIVNRAKMSGLRDSDFSEDNCEHETGVPLQHDSSE